MSQKTTSTSKFGLDLAREGNVVGEVFTDKLIDQALALARFYPHKINKNAPKLLVDAASAYFGTDRPAGWNERQITWNRGVATGARRDASVHQKHAELR